MRTHVRVILAYIGLGLLLTWPLLMHFTTHVPGDGIDDPSLAWNLWWVKHALVDQPQNPFACAWQFWPIGINLAFYTLTVLNGMLSIPLQGAFGLVPAYNVLLLSSFVLSGLGAYLLGLDLLGAAGKTGRGRWAAFLGGALYAFASAKLFYAALGQGNIASSQWAPFAVLYILRLARNRGRVRDAGLAGLFLILQAYAELTYASFLLVFAALVCAWALARHLTRATHGWRGRAALPLVTRFVALGLVFGAGIAPVLANMLPDLQAEGDFFTSGGGFADEFSADLAGYLVPTQLHPVLGDVVRGWSATAGFPVDKGQQVYVGYAATALAVAGVYRGRRRPATWFWVTAAGVFFLLTLGPSLRIAGSDTGLPLPFRILAQLPFFKGNRYPSRYSVMLLLSLAPLVAAGAHALLTPRAAHPAARPVILFAAFAGLMLFEHLSAPLPISDLRVPALYDRVAEAPGDFALLELPLGWRNGARVAGKQDVLIMQELWAQTTHGKRLLGGNTSRNPEFKFQYFSENPTLARLIALTHAADLPQHDALREALTATPIADQDRILAQDWAAFTNIRYVMVHRDKLPVQTEAAALALLPLTLVGEEGELALYEVAPTAPPRRFNLNSDAGRLALGEGWSPPQGGDGRSQSGELRPIYAQRRAVRLLLPLGMGAVEVSIVAAATGAEQTVSLIVDGQDWGPREMTPQAAAFSWQLPARPRTALSDVRLRFARTSPVADASGASVLVRSAGQETGDFAHIYVDGIDRSPNRRGYNLVALPGAGLPVVTAVFDTHADPQAGRRLAEWLGGQAPGTLIAGAVRDEASQQLSDEAVAALRGLGLAGDLRRRFRWGHAFIASVPGAAGAIPVEAVDGIRPVQASLGLPVSAPETTAAVFTVTVEPEP